MGSGSSKLGEAAHPIDFTFMVTKVWCAPLQILRLSVLLDCVLRIRQIPVTTA